MGPINQRETAAPKKKSRGTADPPCRLRDRHGTMSCCSALRSKHRRSHWCVHVTAQPCACDRRGADVTQSSPLPLPTPPTPHHQRLAFFPLTCSWRGLALSYGGGREVEGWAGVINTEVDLKPQQHVLEAHVVAGPHLYIWPVNHVRVIPERAVFQNCPPPPLNTQTLVTPVYPERKCFRCVACGDDCLEVMEHPKQSHAPCISVR